jgi:hypothetical protein
MSELKQINIIDILNKSDPDFVIEEFWYGFKNSMINFYTTAHIPSRNITRWSENLNILKVAKNYELIEINIRNYMSLYALDVMKYEKNSTYNGNILNTNIKRWNTISLNSKFTISEKPNNILLLFDIFNSIKNKISMLSEQLKKEQLLSNPEETKQILNKLIEIFKYFEDIEVLIYFDDFDQLIKLSIEVTQIKILNTIRKIIGESKFVRKINELYPNIVLDKNITCEKICKTMKSN